MTVDLALEKTVVNVQTWLFPKKQLNDIFTSLYKRGWNYDRKSALNSNEDYQAAKMSLTWVFKDNHIVQD